jgi:hypothetical protein
MYPPCTPLWRVCIFVGKWTSTPRPANHAMKETLARLRSGVSCLREIFALMRILCGPRVFLDFRADSHFWFTAGSGARIVA